MLFCMTIGFAVIRFAQGRFADAVLRRADQLAVTDNVAVKLPSELVAAARTDLLNAPRTWQQRFLSLKSLHGLLMTMAWWQMAGRAGITNPAADWKGCYTYPALKNPTLPVVQLVPESDPEFFRDESQFFSLVTFPSITVFILIGLAYSYFASNGHRANDNSIFSRLCSPKQAREPEGSSAIFDSK